MDTAGILVKTCSCIILIISHIYTKGTAPPVIYLKVNYFYHFFQYIKLKTIA